MLAGTAKNNEKIDILYTTIFSFDFLPMKKNIISTLYFCLVSISAEAFELSCELQNEKIETVTYNGDGVVMEKFDVTYAYADEYKSIKIQLTDTACLQVKHEMLDFVRTGNNGNIYCNYDKSGTSWMWDIDISSRKAIHSINSMHSKFEKGSGYDKIELEFICVTVSN